jgi:hypothetical protein
MYSCSRMGVPRMTSMYTLIKKRRIRERDIFSIATTVPRITPRVTAMQVKIKVVFTPSRR